MKRRRIALLATAAVAAPVFLGGASAVADTVSARAQSRPVATARTSDDGRNEEGGGLVARFRGVPAEFEAGGAWQEFDLVLKNITEEELSDFTMDIQLITLYPGESLQPSHVSVQAKFDGPWGDLELWDMGGRDVDVILPVDGMRLAPGETVIPLRMKFAGDAPSVRFHIGPQPDEDHAEESSEDYWESAWIIRPAGPDPSPDPSVEPSEDPDPEPSVDPEPSEDPDPEPSVDPEPSADPDPEPSVDPEPSEDPDPEPSEHPGPEPSADPGPEPSTDPEPDPSVDPEPEPSTDPSSSPDPDPHEEPAPGPGTGGGAATGGGAGGGGTGPAPGGGGGVPGGGTGASSGGTGQGGWTAPATGGVSASGGGLAHTGSDAVTSWALGAGGTLVLLGSALAVAGRRARRRSSGV
ncbi:hypothetical protein KME66_13780 [Streptomyces sp. YPW6]|uniref:hypothetical protein n=1 Tax=Streptomyces sp. YPW6 TaxID=2840373 RepID=UPI001C0E3CC6|nr:hypothetical protein [Streptomyces sp. YPW6]QWQ41955.1 hypothetical protein KME66_13780 [Streptomyces sp. YPW6]